MHLDVISMQRVKKCAGFSEISLLINAMNIVLQGHAYEFFVGYIDESRKFEVLWTRGLFPSIESSKYREIDIKL